MRHQSMYVVLIFSMWPGARGNDVTRLIRALNFVLSGEFDICSPVSAVGRFCSKQVHKV